MTPEITRKQLWCKIAVLIADGMPAPSEITFWDPTDPAAEYAVTMLDIVVDNAAAFWRWAEYFGATAEDPTWSEHLTSWRQRARCDWRGYSLTLKTHNASSRGEVDGMAAVRAIADETSRAGDSDAAPEASAIATTQPGDTNLPRGGEEVAGPAGEAGPATAPGDDDEGPVAGCECEDCEDLLIDAMDEG